MNHIMFSYVGNNVVTVLLSNDDGFKLNVIVGFAASKGYIGTLMIVSNLSVAYSTYHNGHQCDK